MLPDNQTGEPEGAEAFACRVAGWWFDAQAAQHAGQTARARRFLRWVLIACPQDEEAWLQIAKLAARPAEELVYLRQAIRFHPSSLRLQAAMRAAWERQLQLSSGPLAAGRRVARCLPCRVTNGNGRHPAPSPTAPAQGRS